MLSISSETWEGNFQIDPVSFALSVEQRVNHNLIIQASIEIGRSRYWRSLWSSHDFADQPLENCTDVVHTDIVDVWRLRDSDGYLLSTEFKTKMYNLVKTLAEPLTTAPSRPKGNTALCGRQASIHKACNFYRNGIENIRYMVGYIVDLTIILHALFVSTHDDVSACKVQEVMYHHFESGLQIEADSPRYLPLHYRWGSIHVSWELPRRGENGRFDQNVLCPSCSNQAFCLIYIVQSFAQRQENSYCTRCPPAGTSYSMHGYLHHAVFHTTSFASLTIV